MKFHRFEFLISKHDRSDDPSSARTLSFIYIHHRSPIVRSLHHVLLCMNGTSIFAGSGRVALLLAGRPE